MEQGTSFERFGFGLDQGDSSGTELILAAQRGDATAFEELVLPYDVIVMRVALALTGSEPEAQDIYCRVFSDAFTSVNKLHSGSSVFVWLCRILVKRCIEYCRYEGRAKRDDPETSASLSLALVLRGLPPTERVTFLLKHSQGLKICTLAEVFECSSERIVRTLQNATTDLRARLKAPNHQVV